MDSVLMSVWMNIDLRKYISPTSLGFIPEDWVLVCAQMGALKIRQEWA